MIAESLVDWNALGQVVVYSLVAGIGVPAVYALVVLGVSRSSEPQRSRFSASVYAVLALVGGLACLGAIAYGIWLMTQK